jgi:hypothetical protein
MSDFGMGDFGSRYGKAPIGGVSANGVAMGVAVISPKSAKTSSKTAFTLPDSLS